MKRKLSILVALLMTFAMVTNVKAADTGSITVTNATIGKEYTGYKVLDATWSGDKVSYSIDSGSPWYAAVSASGSPFTLTQVGSTNKYNVIVDDASAVITWLNAQTLPVTPDLATITAATNEVKWNSVPYGYYLITTTLGSVVTITNVNDDVNIIDKNQKPGWENPHDPTGDPNQGKNVSADGITFGPESTASIDDIVYFELTAHTPKHNGDKQVFEYKFTDTLDSSLTYNANSVVVKLGGTILTAGTQYTLNVTGQVITVVIRAYEGFSNGTTFPADDSLVISFNATLNEGAVYENKNKADMTWTEFDPTDDPGDPGQPNEPVEPPSTPPTTETKTYTYGFNLQKYKESVASGNELEGAEFKLYDAATGGNEIKVVKVDDGEYRVAVDGETGVAIEAGYAEIFGLAEGTYYLEETVVPDGYNELTGRVEVEITKAGTTDGILSPVNVVNLSGTVLPETGGIGTTIFYVVGGSLMILAAVIFVTRRKLSV